MTMHTFMMILPFLIIAVCFVLRVPVALSIFVASIAYFLLTKDDLSLISNAVMGSMYSNNTLVAAPLFIFLANIMMSSKVSEYMYQFCRAIFTGKRGATAYVNILASLIFAGMSGSALADACGTGMMEIDEMKRDGYDGPFSCALSAATACVGPIFPPSVSLVIFAMLSGASVGKLFMGGVVPAVLICLSLGVYVYFISKKRNYPRGETYTFKEFLSFTWKALPALMTPVILLVGMYSGIVTATEAGVLASFYAIIISIFVYRVLTVKDFFAAIKNTVIQSSVVMATLASVYALNIVVVKSGLGAAVANLMLGITHSPLAFLLIVNVVFIICGMLMPGEIPTFVIIPMLLPVARALGIDMIHFGVVVTVNLILGMVTPPYGLMCFVISGASGESLSKIFKEVLPMALIMFAILFLLVLCPSLVTAIPNAMG